MIPLPLAQIAEIIGARPDLLADRSAVVTGPVVIDSRQAGPGSLFAALPGERADGHDFARRWRPARSPCWPPGRPVPRR